MADYSRPKTEEEIQFEARRVRAVDAFKRVPAKYLTVGQITAGIDALGEYEWDMCPQDVLVLENIVASVRHG